MRRRPRSHITAPSNWLNDPNGPIHHAGRYHLFYQFNPESPAWGRPHWGHVSSADLVSWIDHRVALTPSDDGADRDGCWSGCLRMIDGRPSIFYTGVVGEGAQRVEAVCRADGSEDLMYWSQRPQPLIRQPPSEVGTRHHRDPYLFRGGAGWRMLLGSGLRGGHGRAGAILLYESADLEAWAYRGVLYRRPEGLPPIDTGPLWECPQLVQLEGRDILLFSVQMEGQRDPLRYAVYVTGRLGDLGFTEESMGLVDHGDAFYAPAVTRDAAGRTLLWGWIKESDVDDEADHAGALSLPRILEVVDGGIAFRPAPELVGLRAHAQPLGDVVAPECRDGVHVPLPGPHCEFVATLAGTGTGVIEFVTASTATVGRIELDLARQEARIHGQGKMITATLDEAFRSPEMNLRLFVDGSIVELFLNGALALTTRNYQLDGTALRLASVHGDVSFRASSHFTLNPALPERTAGKA